MLFKDRNRRDNIECTGTYVQCRECSLVYLRERPEWEQTLNYNSSIGKDSDTNTGKIDIVELRRQVEAAVPTWKKILRKVRFRPHSWPLQSVPEGSKRILDLGCGNGAKLFEFYKRGYEVWGVDVSEDSIRFGKKLLPQGRFITGELQETNLPDECVDYIRIDSAFEHVPNPKEIANECYRLLRANGKLMIYVPHGKSLSMKLMKSNSISSWIPFHLQLFTSKSLKRLLTEAGFKEIKIYMYNPTSWLPLSLKQWKSRKKKIMNTSTSTWLDGVCYPIGWIAARVGMGEEIIAIAKK